MTRGKFLDEEDKMLKDLKPKLENGLTLLVSKRSFIEDFPVGGGAVGVQEESDDTVMQKVS